MRIMSIPRFPRTIEIPDLENFIRTRLSQITVMWPEQAIPLLGYMCYPNDPEGRDKLVRTVRSWPLASEAAPPVIPEDLGRIQHEWLRVADTFHTYWDLIEGQLQERRGGASIGKAITLVEAKAKSRGTGAAILWKHWATYKDVAHLVTAAALICRQARSECLKQSFGPFGLHEEQIIPFQMALLMPDLVLAVGLVFEARGLSVVPHSRNEPTFDPETLWRIPPNVNVVPLPALTRLIGAEDKVLLNSRRAGNRGRANAPKTTPVSA